MDLLLDQDVYGLTASFLKNNGHDVVTASEIGHASSSDSTLLKIAQKKHRIFITRDKDFGVLVFTRKIKTGVILLRISPSTINSCHKELDTVLKEHSFDELINEFIVVEPGRHRLRKISD